MTPPELPRPLAADRVGAAGLTILVEATEAELPAIASRLLVPAVAGLRCEWRLRAGQGGHVEAEGSLHARVRQVCVVTLDEFDTDIVEEFAVQFVPAGLEEDEADDPDEPDQIPFEGSVLELGEATVEQLALALDPYPRRPGAELAALGPDPDETAWAALAKWRQSP